MRTWTFGLVVMVVAAAPAVGQDKPDPKAVIRKAVEAHGGADLLNKFRAGEYDVKGRMTVAGAESDFTGKVVYQLPDKYKMTLDLDVGGMKVALGQTTNGKDSVTTLNGKEQNVSDAQKAEAVQAAAMQEVTQLTPLLTTTRYTLKAEKDADLDGAKAAVVTVSADGIKDVTLYFDAKTGRLLRTSRKGLSPEEREVTEESVLTDYKKVDGVLLPMAVEVTHDGKKFMSLAITSAKLMESVDAKRFAVKDADKGN